MTMKRISTDTFCQKAYLSVKESIITGGLKPGALLPSKELAEQLGISSTPIREALIRLTSEGFVAYKSNKKRCVAPITVESVHEIYEVRKLLEPYAASILARSTASDGKIKSELLELRERSDSVLFHTATAEVYGELVAIDLQLSAILIEGILGSFLAEVLNWVNDRSLRTRTFLETSRQREGKKFVESITQEHGRIIEALLEGNPEQAAAATYEHLVNAECRVMRLTRSLKGEPHP